MSSADFSHQVSMCCVCRRCHVVQRVCMSAWRRFGGFFSNKTERLSVLTSRSYFGLRASSVKY